jgi:hypothetical protein
VSSFSCTVHGDTAFFYYVPRLMTLPLAILSHPQRYCKCATPSYSGRTRGRGKPHLDRRTNTVHLKCDHSAMNRFASRSSVFPFLSYAKEPFDVMMIYYTLL